MLTVAVMLSTRALVSAASLALALACHGSAEACTGMSCPASSNYLPWSGTVPASLPGILVYYRGSGDPADVGKLNLGLFRVEAGTQVPVEHTAQVVNGSVLITPALPFMPESDYAVEGKDVCAGGISMASFHTGATAPLPTTLGTLTAAAPRLDMLSVAANSLCSVTVPATIAEVDIALSAEALPWQGALSFRTFVDGAPWAYRTSALYVPSLGGTMHELLWASCGDPIYAFNGLDVGTHSVRMEATIPGSTTVLATESISVTLTCPAGSGAGGGGAGGGGAGGGGAGGGGAGGGGADGGGNASSGCQMGLGGQDGVWAIGVVAALAMMGRRRRRSPMG